MNEKQLFSDQDSLPAYLVFLMMLDAKDDEGTSPFL
jgi:hypothetical protein